MKRRTVRIKLRDGVARAMLAEAENRIRVSCGAAMQDAVSEILSGAPSAEVDRIAIKIATDTTDGVHAVFDYFDVDDARSGRPLLWELLKESKLA